MIEHPITTQRALTEAARLEPSTAAVRALNDAMALVCEQLLGGDKVAGVQQEIQTPHGRHS